MKTLLTPLNRKEEIVNSLTHLPGIIFGLIALPFLTVYAASHHNENITAGVIIYGICFLLVFTASSLFHIQQKATLRKVLKKLDHISIYFMIAGTYTPFILIYLNNSYGKWLLIILWGLTAVGTVFKLFFTGKFELLSVFIYIAMGWMCLLGADKFFSPMPGIVQNLIITGGILYTTGVIFYIWKLHSFHHAIWHLFVLFAALCHFSAVSLSV